MFGVDATQQVHHDLWDITTVVLRKAIRQYVKAGDQVLELGTGQLAVLSIYCAKRRGARVLAVDISQRFLDNAADVARASGEPRIEFRWSDWFSKVADSKFDIIFANMPYIPTAMGEQAGAMSEHRQMWDGGEDGCDPVRIVLRDAPLHLAPQGRLLLGMNTMYVPRSQTLSLIRAAPGLQFETIVRLPFCPSEVYVASSSHGRPTPQ